MTVVTGTEAASLKNAWTELATQKIWKKVFSCRS